MFQHRVYFNDLRGDSGLPLAHPLYVIVARAFAALLPIEDFALRVNLFSALCGALTIAFAFRLLLNCSRSFAAAGIGAVALAVSHTFWTHSVIAEVYNLYALGLVVELWCVERFLATRRSKWFVLALFVNGLNLSNHLMALLHAPAYAILCLHAIRARHLQIARIPIAVAAFLLGTLPYSWLILEDIGAGGGVFETIKLAIVGPPERANKVLDLNFSLLSQSIRTAQYFALNFPTPLIILAPIGLWRLLKNARHNALAVFGAIIFAVDGVFAFRYPVPDQFVFYTPCYVLTAIAIGVGAAYILARLQTKNRTRPPAGACLGLFTLAALPVAVYAVAPPLMKKLDINIGAKRDIHYRDTIAYFIRPWKCGEVSARRFAEAAFEQAKPDGLLYADTTIKNVLVYLRDVENMHTNVTLTTGHDTTPRPPVIHRTPQAVAPFVAAGKAYICSDASDYVPDWIRERWTLEPAGIIFKMTPGATAD